MSPRSLPSATWASPKPCENCLIRLPTHTHTTSLSAWVLFHIVPEFFIVPSTQIHLGAADHRPFVLHATGQLQRRPRALPSLHVPHNDPTQQFHDKPVPVSLPRSASGFSALPAATAAPAVLSGMTPICCVVMAQC